MARVSVVIPTWNGVDLLAHALESVGRQTYQDFDVVVVDNASTDGTLEMLAREHPDVEVVRLDRNRGFAGSVNAGIRASEGEIVALLNNDAEADPDWLTHLVEALDADPELGSCASKMLDFHDRTLIDSAGDQLGIFASQRGHGMPDGPAFSEPREVLSACAGAAAYRRELFDDVGMFDERYFAYFEDVDLGVRARLAGYRCLYVPDAVVYHLGSATARRVSETAFYLRSRNALILGFQYLPARRLLPFGPLLLVLPFARALLDGQRIATAFRAVRDFLGELPEAVRRRRRAFRERRIPMATFRDALASPLTRGKGERPRGLPTRSRASDGVERPVDVVIVNWNGRRWLPDCLTALSRSTVPVRVLLVDNASSDDSVDYVRGEHPWVEVAELSENTGYAAGSNEGLRRAEGAYALVMNPDVLLAPDHVERLVERLEASPGAGIAQGKLYRIEPEEFSADTVALEGALDSAGHVIPKTRRVIDRGQGHDDGPEFAGPASVFSACGAAIFLRRAMWEDVAPDGEVFDEAFFAYKEEIDLCWRARWLGWDVVYEPSAVAGHVRTWAGGLPPKERIGAVARRHSWKNHYLLVAKNDRVAHLLAHLPWVLGWEIVRLAYALLRDPAVYGSYPAVLRRLPEALRRRRELFRRRRVEPSEMRRWLGAEPRPLAELQASSAVGPASGPG